MAFTFSDEDIERIASVLEVQPKLDGGAYRFDLTDETSGRSLALEIRSRVTIPDALLDDGTINIVSIYATSSFLQIQDCTGYIASKELGEVIFVAKSGEATSGLVVERIAGCSMYANVADRLLSADFTKLPPELIMSSVALSLSDSLFDDLG